MNESSDNQPPDAANVGKCPRRDMSDARFFSIVVLIHFVVMTPLIANFFGVRTPLALSCILFDLPSFLFVGAIFESFGLWRSDGMGEFLETLFGIALVLVGNAAMGGDCSIR